MSAGPLPAVGEPLAMRVSLVREGAPVYERVKLSAPGDAARYLIPLIPDDGCEHFGVIFLSVRHNVIGHVELGVGCLTGTLVHPREVFGPALVAKAAAIVVYHNHPSGDPEPSAEDLALTRRLAAGGTLLGVELLDHVVIGSGTPRWVSLKERGAL